MLHCAQDLLYVISYGPSQVKPPAVQMLFHYWPNLKPPGAISEYRGLQYTGQIQLMSHLLLTLSCPSTVKSTFPSSLHLFSLTIFFLVFSELAWNPIHCQHIECHNAINKPAVKVISVISKVSNMKAYICDCWIHKTGPASHYVYALLLEEDTLALCYVFPLRTSLGMRGACARLLCWVQPCMLACLLLWAPR